MRILLFTDSFYPELGGIQDSLVATSRELGAWGHQVPVCAPSAGRRDFDIANLAVGEIDLGPNVMIRRLLSLPAPSSTRQSRLLLPIGWRWPEMARFRPDVVHTHTFLGAGWEALRTAHRLRVPLIGTNHWAVGEFGAYLPVPTKLFTYASIGAVTWYYNHCHVVTGPSRSVLDEMQAFGLRRPHFVVSNPIDTSLFCPAPSGSRKHLKKAFSFSEATILYAGRLAVENNIDVLVHALALLRHEIPNAMLVLAGHGTARQGLEALVRELGVASGVRFLGTLSPAALADAYRGADVFATASTSETQGMALLQAMSSGLPTVGARRRALTEYIPRDVGFLAEPGAPDDFADKLAVLLRQPALRDEMGERAMRFAQRFALTEVVSTWEEIYDSITEAPSMCLRDAA